jgi:hypothetical protein
LHFNGTIRRHSPVPGNHGYSIKLRPTFVKVYLKYHLVRLKTFHQEKQIYIASSAVAVNLTLPDPSPLGLAAVLPISSTATLN